MKNIKREKKNDDYVKYWNEVIKDIERGYKTKIDIFFKNVGYEKEKFRHEDGKYYYPELVALVLQTYLGKEFLNNQLRSYFKNKHYDKIKYSDRNEFFLEVYEALIKKYENTDELEGLKNQQVLLQSQYDEYEIFYNEINDRITAFGDKMKKLVREVIPQATGIRGISEEVFIPEMQWFMEEPTLDTLNDIAQIRDIDTYRGFVCNKIGEENGSVYPSRSILFRADVKIMMNALEELFENAQSEWERVYVNDFKRQRINEIELEKEKNSKVEDLQTDEYLTTYFEIDKEAMFTTEEMGEFVLMRTFFQRRADEYDPDDMGGLLNHPELNQPILLSIFFKGLEITKENDSEGIISNLKNILNLEIDVAQSLYNQLDNFIYSEGCLNSESAFGKAIYIIFNHRKWSRHMDIEDLASFFSGILRLRDLE